MIKLTSLLIFFISILSCFSAESRLGELPTNSTCNTKSELYVYATCLQSKKQLPTDKDNTHDFSKKLLLLKAHPALANASCFAAGMSNLQAFKDCMWGHLSTAQAKDPTEKKVNLALVQCFGIYDLKAFRDCAWGHLTISNSSKSDTELPASGNIEL